MLGVVREMVYIGFLKLLIFFFPAVSQWKGQIAYVTTTIVVKCGRAARFLRMSSSAKSTPRLTNCEGTTFGNRAVIFLLVLCLL